MQARWKTNEAGMRRLIDASRVEVVGKTPRYVRFLDDFPAFPFTEVWADVGGAPDKIYAVQTNVRIVERCLLMTTQPGDLVLDPFMGSGTTAVAARRCGRDFVGFELNPAYCAIIDARLASPEAQLTARGNQPTEPVRAKLTDIKKAKRGRKKADATVSATAAPADFSPDSVQSALAFDDLVSDNP